MRPKVLHSQPCKPQGEKKLLPKATPAKSLIALR